MQLRCIRASSWQATTDYRDAAQGKAKRTRSRRLGLLLGRSERDLKILREERLLRYDMGDACSLSCMLRMADGKKHDELGPEAIFETSGDGRDQDAGTEYLSTTSVAHRRQCHATGLL